MSGGAWRLPEAAEAQSTYLSHALALAALHGPGPWPDGGYPLPDEDPEREQLMSGAVLDGVRTHHFGSKPDPDAGSRIADLVTDLVTGPPSRQACASLHAALADHPALDLADALGDQLRRQDLPADRLRAVGRWLAEHGTRREAVAGEIVLLGLAGDERDRDLLLLLGALEDLTLYAVVALVSTQPDRDRAVFELARRVDGWGRIQAAERLTGTSDPEIKGWLLRDGFRNKVMTEYLAHLAATTGELYTALLDPEPDEALLDGSASSSSPTMPRASTGAADPVRGWPPRAANSPGSHRGARPSKALWPAPIFLPSAWLCGPPRSWASRFVNASGPACPPPRSMAISGKRCSTAARRLRSAVSSSWRRNCFPSRTWRAGRLATTGLACFTLPTARSKRSSATSAPIRATGGS
jgi:hypothetical protein